MFTRELDAPRVGLPMFTVPEELICKRLVALVCMIKVLAELVPITALPVDTLATSCMPELLIAPIRRALEDVLAIFRVPVIEPPISFRNIALALASVIVPLSGYELVLNTDVMLIGGGYEKPLMGAGV